MTWGREAIEELFGGPRMCDLCLDPAVAFLGGRSRCETHLTEQMRESRARQGQGGDLTALPGRPEHFAGRRAGLS